MNLNVQRLYRLGTGCGVEIRGDDLQVVAVKSRPKGVTLLGQTEIRAFRERRPEEWGAEYKSFLGGLGLTHLSATVGLPRGEVIVRLIYLPPVKGKELKSAVSYQLEALHPLEPDSVYYAYAPLEEVTEELSQLPVVVVIAERAKVDVYADLFEAAGMLVEAFTVNASSFYAGVRVRWDEPPKPFVFASQYGEKLEIYGEGLNRPVFSAEFDLAAMSRGRALQLASADLRLQESQKGALVTFGGDGAGADSGEGPGAFERKAAAEMLPSPVSPAGDFEWERDAVGFSVALESACPRLGWRANLLPAERRRGSSRWMYLPTAVFGVALGILALMFLLRPIFQDSSYARAIEAETARLQEQVRQVNAMSAEAKGLAARALILEALDRRVGEDLKIISELSKRLPNSVWLQSLELNDTDVQMNGQATVAAPLLEVIDESETLQNAAFLTSLQKVEGGQRFQIAADRRGGTIGKVLDAAETLNEASSAAPASSGATLEVLSEVGTN